jgi:FtsH-binding integral membrane protein
MARPYKRSPLVILAYGALIAAIVNLFFRSGLFWIAGSAALAVLFAIAEIILQIRNRGAPAPHE